MLKELSIKNLAIIDQADLEFFDGFTVVTGMTGAGKSLIVGALQALFGENDDTDLISTGASECVISARFILDERESSRLNELGIQGDQVVVNRRVKREGYNQTRLNGEIISLSELDKLGKYLVDLHGQHQHQLLLNSSEHRKILDSFSGLSPEVEDFKKGIQKYRELLQEKNSLYQEKEELKEVWNLKEQQLKELEEAELSKGEKEELEEKLQVLGKVNSLKSAISHAINELSEGDENILDQLGNIYKDIEEIVNTDKSQEHLLEFLETANASLVELCDGLSQYDESLDLDPQELTGMEDRLNFLLSLENKYKKSVDDLIVYRDELASEHEDLAKYDEKIKEVEKQLESLNRRLQSLGEEIHKQRKSAAVQLEEKLETVVSELGMEETNFKADIKVTPKEGSDFCLNDREVEVHSYGFEDVEFLISPNPGERLKPLKKIASGGEISRVMLAFKKVLARQDIIKTLVFDEIDVGVGGKVANKVGETLQELAQSHQVIALTHLHQIASKGEHHYKVSKKKRSTEGESAVQMEQLKGESRVDELTRMLGSKKEEGYGEKFAKEFLED